MRWSLERMKEEVRNPQPGGSLITQQLAYVMLVQALRLHLADGARGGVGWLFALADKQMCAAITCIHDDPGHPWTLQELAERVGMSRSIFALRFKETVGADSHGVSDTLANDAGWPQVEDFRRFSFSNRLIAWLRIRKRLR